MRKSHLFTVDTGSVRRGFRFAGRMDSIPFQIRKRLVPMIRPEHQEGICDGR
jgi:hypothetical protein